MWLPWRRPKRKPDQTMTTHRVYGRKEITEYVPRVLSLEMPQKPLITKESRISKAEAIESLLRIVHVLEPIWVEGRTDQSLMIRSAVYAWTFAESSGQYQLKRMSECNGRRAAGGETWGKDPVQELSHRDSAQLFRTLRGIDT